MRNMHQKTIWSDEDGVIAIYEPHAYSIPHGKNSLFLTPDVHYFMSLRADTRITKAYETLQTKHKLPICVLTNLTEQYPLWEEHKADKIKWTKNAMPFLDMETQFHAIHTPKYKFAEDKLKRPLCKTDILISDYNHDLIPWEEAGGTAVKYLNGINSEDSFSGAKIYPDWTSEQISDFLLTL